MSAPHERLYQAQSFQLLMYLSSYPPSSIYSKAYKLGLKKSKEILAKLGEPLKKYGTKTRFKTGNSPPNKGKKQHEYMSAVSIGESAKTRFTVGHTPHNWKPVGSTRITKDGYCEVKVKEPNKWQLLHRKVWVMVNGAIPPGYNVQFRDKNRLNCAPSNLYIIDRKTQMINNSINRLPKELISVIKLASKLNKQLKNHGKK